MILLSNRYLQTTGYTVELYRCCMYIESRGEICFLSPSWNMRFIKDRKYSVRSYIILECYEYPPTYHFHKRCLYKFSENKALKLKMYSPIYDSYSLYYLWDHKQHNSEYKELIVFIYSNARIGANPDMDDHFKTVL